MSLEVVSDTPAPVPAKEVEVLVDQEKEEVAEKAVPTKVSLHGHCGGRY